MYLLRYVDDEIEIGEIVKSIGFQHISLSHNVMPMLRIVSRGYTACADAYLTPCIKKYMKVTYFKIKYFGNEKFLLFLK